MNFLPTVCVAAISSVVALSQLLLTLQSPARAAEVEQVGASATCTSCARVNDQVWVINTRGLPCVAGAIHETPAFRVQRLNADNTWAASNLDEFLANDAPGVDTSFVIHGNRFDSSDAINYGMTAYHRLTTTLPADRPVRFVIWSWPADPDRGPLRDARTYSGRTTAESIYLGLVIHRINPQVPVSLVGYSYGARIATGGLHLLGGGTLAGFSLEQLPKAHRPMSAVLVAAAIDNDWLLPGRAHGNALIAADKVLSMNNYCDAVLKRYSKVDRRGRDALGYTGLAGSSPWYSKVEQVNACCVVGKSHEWERYLAAAGLTTQMQRYLWQPLAK